MTIECSLAASSWWMARLNLLAQNLFRLASFPLLLVLLVLRHPSLFNSGDGIAAADYGGSPGILRQSFSNRRRSVGKSRHFENSHGAIPDDGARFSDFGDKQVLGRRPNPTQPRGPLQTERSPIQVE
jgi:hypothetical protein